MENKKEYTLNELLDMYISGEINDEQFKEIELADVIDENDSTATRMAREAGALSSLVTVLLLEMKYPTNKSLIKRVKETVKNDL